MNFPQTQEMFAEALVILWQVDPSSVLHHACFPAMCIAAEIYTDPRMEIWQGFDLNDPVITPTDGQHIYLSNYVERFPFWYIVSNTCI